MRLRRRARQRQLGVRAGIVWTIQRQQHARGAERPVGLVGVQLDDASVSLEGLLIPAQPPQRRCILRPDVGHRRILVQDRAEQARAFAQPAVADELDRLPVGAKERRFVLGIGRLSGQLADDDCVPT